jgi:hypothetical protein
MHQSSFIGSYTMNSPRSMTVLKDLSNLGFVYGSNSIIEWAIRQRCSPVREAKTEDRCRVPWRFSG